MFSGIPGKVWEDTHAEGVPREEMDRDSSGLRQLADRIMGSQFELTFSYRAVSIDVERTGEGVTSVVCDERDSYDSCTEICGRLKTG